jgi:hypothetical protein
MTQSSTQQIMASGRFILFGDLPSNLSETALAIIENALAKELQPNAYQNVFLDDSVIIKSYTNKRGSGSSSSAVTFFEFQLTLSLNTIQQSSSMDMIGDMSQQIVDLESYLGDSMEDGDFISNIVERAIYSDESCLKSVFEAHLLELSIDTSSVKDYIPQNSFFDEENNSNGNYLQSHAFLIFEGVMGSAFLVLSLFLYVQYRNFTSVPNIYVKDNSLDSFKTNLGRKDVDEMDASNRHWATSKNREDIGNIDTIKITSTRIVSALKKDALDIDNI